MFKSFGEMGKYRKRSRCISISRHAPRNKMEESKSWRWAKCQNYYFWVRKQVSSQRIIWKCAATACSVNDWNVCEKSRSG